MEKLTFIFFVFFYNLVIGQNNYEKETKNVEIVECLFHSTNLKDTLSMVKYNYSTNGLLLKRTKFGKNFGDLFLNDFKFIDNVHEYSYKKKKLVEKKIWNTTLKILRIYFELPSKYINNANRTLFSTEHNKSLYIRSQIKHIRNNLSNITFDKKSSTSYYLYDKKGNNTKIIESKNSHIYLNEYDKQNRIIKKTMLDDNIIYWLEDYEYTKDSIFIFHKSLEYPNTNVRDTLLSKITNFFDNKNRLIKRSKIMEYKDGNVEYNMHIIYQESGVIKEIKYWNKYQDDPKLMLSKISTFETNNNIKKLTKKQIMRINSQLIRKNEKKIIPI